MTQVEPIVHRGRWVALTGLLTAEAMNLLDATIVQVAGPAVHHDLGGAVADIQWFSAAYTLAFAMLLVTGGRLGDIAGRRRVFRLGVTGFMITSLACALAPNAGLLIGFRAVQGAAAAAVIPQTIGLIKAMFAGKELPKALGTIGPVMGLAAVCGPVLGGVLTHADLFGSSWRPVFLVNVPLALAVLAVTPLLTEDRAPRRPRLDLVGTALVMLGTGLVVYPLIQTGAPRLPLITLGVLVLGVFVLQQRRRTDPLVEPGLFTGRAFPAALVTSLLFFGVITGLMFVVVLQLQLGLAASAMTAGLTLLPWSVGLALASGLAGARLVARVGDRLMYVGLAVLACGVLGAVWAYGAGDPSAYPVPLLGALAVAGFGNGLFTPAFFTSALHRVRPQETGSAAGLLNAVQQLGGTIGVAVLGGIYLAATTDAADAAQRACWAAAAAVAATTVSVVAMTRRQADKAVSTWA